MKIKMANLNRKRQKGSKIKLKKKSKTILRGRGISSSKLCIN